MVVKKYEQYIQQDEIKCNVEGVEEQWVIELCATTLYNAGQLILIMGQDQVSAKYQ